MATGIRATVEFRSPEVCPVADFAARTDSAVISRSTSVSSAGQPDAVTEFLLDADPPADDAAIEPIFTYGESRLYRLTHEGAAHCPCERLGAFGCPIERYAASEGTLTIVFHAADYDQLQAAIADLRERFPDVDIRRLIRSPTEGTAEDNVFVNRNRLTDRQLEVLRTAYRRGYFERPRRVNATEIAAELGISPSTVTEHLAAAQSKLLEDIFDSG
jgi:predicted DNA binding protein